MIFTNLNDNLQNKSLSQKIQECIKFTKENNLKEYNPGSYEIPGTDIKFNIGKYNTKPENECFWESHLKYIDVQIMLNGKEYIAFNNIRNLKQVKIEKENDFIGYEGDELFRVLIENGDVLILYPEDIHMPGMRVDESIPVEKVVFKIDVDKI